MTVNQIEINNLPAVPTQNMSWVLRRNVRETALRHPSEMADEVAIIDAGNFKIVLVDSDNDKEYARNVVSLEDSVLVGAAHILIDEYISDQRTKALEDGPVSLIPAKKNAYETYILPC